MNGEEANKKALTSMQAKFRAIRAKACSLITKHAEEHSGIMPPEGRARLLVNKNGMIWLQMGRPDIDPSTEDRPLFFWGIKVEADDDIKQHDDIELRITYRTE